MRTITLALRKMILDPSINLILSFLFSLSLKLRRQFIGGQVFALRNFTRHQRALFANVLMFNSLVFDFFLVLTEIGAKRMLLIID